MALPERLRTGMNLVTDGAGVALFTSVYDPPPGARAALEAATGPQPEINFAPYVLGALNTERPRASPPTSQASTPTPCAPSART